MIANTVLYYCYWYCDCKYGQTILLLVLILQVWANDTDIGIESVQLAWLVLLLMLELHIWRESYWNWYWYCIMQKFGIVIDIAIAKFSQNVLILILLLQSEATKYWYCYWYCRPEATAIDIDIELKFSLSHSPAVMIVQPKPHHNDTILIRRLIYRI